MKSFKHTGRGPKYGNFTFPSEAGFGPSSGSVKQVSSYSRRAPKRVMKKAVGGLVEGGPFQTGWNDYARGGKVRNSKTGKKKTPRTSGHKPEKTMALNANQASRNLKATRKKGNSMFED